MSSKIKSTIILTTAILAISVVFYFFLSNQIPIAEVDFLDVGQGDSILLKMPDGQTVLIDGGPDKSVIFKLNEHLSFWDKRIDVVILTHPHDDHVNGLNYVLDNYEVGRVLETGVNHTADSYFQFQEKIKEKNIQLILVNQPSRLDFGDCYLDILWPQKDLSGQTIENLNNSSILSKLVCNNTSFLFTGDLEADPENELLSQNIDLTADVLKVGHHGSNTSTSTEWLKRVNPRIAIISLGKNNMFGFPKSELLERLESKNIEIFQTDINGSISIFSDGQRIWQ